MLMLLLTIVQNRKWPHNVISKLEERDVAAVVLLIQVWHLESKVTAENGECLRPNALV